jgi:cobalt-precorrin-7 (C5)-methyltransferase
VFADATGSTPARCEGRSDGTGGQGRPPRQTHPRAERPLREIGSCTGAVTVEAARRAGRVTALARGPDRIEKTTGEHLACGCRDGAETLVTVADRVADGETGTAVLPGDPDRSAVSPSGRCRRPVRVSPGVSSLQVAASGARHRWRRRSPRPSTGVGMSGQLSAGFAPRSTTDACSCSRVLTTGRQKTSPPSHSIRLPHPRPRRSSSNDRHATGTTLAGLDALTTDSTGETSPFSDLPAPAVRRE